MFRLYFWLKKKLLALQLQDGHSGELSTIFIELGLGHGTPCFFLVYVLLNTFIFYKHVLVKL